MGEETAAGGEHRYLQRKGGEDKLGREEGSCPPGTGVGWREDLPAEVGKGWEGLAR